MFQNIWYQIGRSIVDFYVRFVIKADIYHYAPIPRGAKIIAVNHPCTNDPAFVTIITHEQTTILIKETIFKIPLFGRSLRMAGHVPVVSGNGRAALEAAIGLLKAGRTVVVFPEGEISPENGFHKAHTGVARLALATGAPVIPVGISLNYQKIRQIHTHIDGQAEIGSWYLHGPYAITVGEPASFQGSLEDYYSIQRTTGQIMQKIAALRQHGDLRLMHRALKQANLKHTPRLGVATPEATMRVAWKGTWLAFQQSVQLVLRSAVFKTVESGLLFLLMYARHF